MQRKLWTIAMCCTAALPLLAGPALACSALKLQLAGRPMMARNYDWHIGHALVMLNQPGIAKRALSFDAPASWTSKYGSVTVNQYGRELPCDGINTAGLAIAVLWLDASEYPASDERPSVTSAQWVQYQLDTVATVGEVIASDNAIRITPYGGAKVHYFVADATGDSAVIEFLEGRMIVHRDATSPITHITNHTCQISAEHLAKHEKFGGDLAIPTDGGSLSRYVRLASAAAEIELNGQPPHLVALQTVDQVRQASTQWQIAYDLQARTMVFRTAEHPADRVVDLTKCRFDPGHSVQVLDIEAPLAGDVVPLFRDYTREANARLIHRSVSATEFTRNLPASIVQLMIHYPEVSCQPVSAASALAR